MYIVMILLLFTSPILLLFVKNLKRYQAAGGRIVQFE